MRLVIVRHRETEWTLTGRYTGTTDLGLTANGRQQAALLATLLQRVLHDQRAVLVSSPRQRATETAAHALPAHRVTVEPLVAEYHYGDYEGLTVEQIHKQAPGWDICSDGCPDRESTADVGRRADAFLHAYADNRTQPVVVVTHGHFPRILAARALRLAPEYGCSFASETVAVSLIEDHDGERCVGLWNVDAALLADTAERPAHLGRPRPHPLVPAGGLLP